MIWFLVIVLALVLTMLWALLRSFDVLSEQRTFDILEIFWEEREVFAEYWQETLSTILVELPRWTLGIGVGVAFLFMGFWISTRHKRTIARRRIVELAKWKKK